MNSSNSSTGWTSWSLASSPAPGGARADASPDDLREVDEYGAVAHKP